MKSLAIFHIDLDGISCSVVARVMDLRFTEILCRDYGFDTEDGVLDYLLTFDKIVMADLTFSGTVHQALLDAGINVQVFDHHDNEMNAYVNGLAGSILDHSRCGTKIFFEEYACKQRGRYPVLLKYYVELVNIYDLWKKDDLLWEEAVSLNRILYKYMNYGQSDKLLAAKDYINAQVMKIMSGSDAWFWTSYEAQAIESAREIESLRLTQALETLTLRKDRQGKVFAVFVLPSKISYVASRVLEMMDYLDYCVIINSYKGVSGKISTRSSRGFSCPSLAAVNGHEAAAGGMLTPDDARLFLSDESLVLLYKDDPEVTAGVGTLVIRHPQ